MTTKTQTLSPVENIHPSFGSESEVAISVLRSAIDAIIVIDSRGAIRYCNPATFKLFGYSSDVLLDENVKILMPGTIASQHDEYLSRYFRTGSGSVIGTGREVVAQSEDGRQFAAELSISKTMIDDEIHFVGVIRDISDRRELEDENFQASQVTASINSMLDKFIAANLWNKRELFDDALSSLLTLGESEYGFIGEVLRKDDGVPFLKTHAITNIAWDSETRKFYKENVRNGLEFLNLNTLFGYTIRTGDMLISNSPTDHEHAGGLPPGHPPLYTYLGLPIYAGSRFVGMAGVANRRNGYDEDIVDALRPYVNTLGSVIVGFQNLEDKHRVEQDLYQVQQKMQEMATRDQLTGAMNRHAFFERAEKRFSEAGVQQSPVSILFIDVDHFKEINDTHGHIVGDQVLQNIATKLEEDLRPSDFVGRFGGEEFVVYLGGAELHTAKSSAERLRQAVAASPQHDGLPPVTISVGISSISPDGAAEEATLESMIERADSACYQAKADGRNCVRDHAPDAIAANSQFRQTQPPYINSIED